MLKYMLGNADTDTVCVIVCHRGNVPGKENCSFFQWADFDDDGIPSWDSARYRKASATAGHGPGVSVTEKQHPIVKEQ